MTNLQKIPQYLGIGIMIFGILFAANETFNLINVKALVVSLAFLGGLVLVVWSLWTAKGSFKVDEAAPRKPR